MPGFPVLHYLPEFSSCLPLFSFCLQSFPASVFSNESALHIRWPKCWNFSFSISPSNEYSGLISLRIDWFDLPESKGLSRVFSSTAVRNHQFFSTQPSLWSTLTFVHDYWKNNQRRQWHPTPVLLPRKSHRRRSLVGCSP